MFSPRKSWARCLSERQSGIRQLECLDRDQRLRTLVRKDKYVSLLVREGQATKHFCIIETGWAGGQICVFNGVLKHFIGQGPVGGVLRRGPNGGGTEQDGDNSWEDGFAVYI